nr:uncharacterized protein LOC109181254 [Ipomoea trifida]
MQVPPKVKLFCWQLASSVLPTRDALLSKHILIRLDVSHVRSGGGDDQALMHGLLASLCYLVLHGAVYYAACLSNVTNMALSYLSNWKAVNEKLMGRTEEGVEMSKW